jgi:hypothetical protein
MHWPITDCQLADLEDPLCPQRWTPIQAKIFTALLCRAAPKQTTKVLFEAGCMEATLHKHRRPRTYRRFRIS